MIVNSLTIIQWIAPIGLAYSAYRLGYDRALRQLAREIKEVLDIEGGEE